MPGGVAHDFNNLLTVIMGYGDMVASSVSPESEVGKLVTEINNAAEQAASLTQQLLAFSRHQVMVPRVLNLNNVIGNLNRMLQRLIGEHVEISIHLKNAYIRSKPTYLRSNR